VAAETIGVGIIGASAEGGWAKESHVPAVRALAGLELVAVATTSQSNADAAARAFGARSGYGDAAAMFRDSAVELVAIAVKVPAHRDLVLGALAAGKHPLRMAARPQYGRIAGARRGRRTRGCSRRDRLADA